MSEQVTFKIDDDTPQTTMTSLKQSQELEVLAQNLVNRSYKLMDGKIIVDEDALKELAAHLGLELITVPF